ncbi:hypothetical protein [Alkalicoccobacillus porphyridii]|uniref:Uncharacterized protein n=1 Tax=Alkalicoccobacillus porphyridii TaxID=2597270 RepID=A0A554A164_9BACI|nr:hypothetical protein [Alkalicoccobacillus porphyridii]TSB47440.1 hypothetical protein FN960_06810 [Alkalicoccobacillus porphyridii]
MNKAQSMDNQLHNLSTSITTASIVSIVQSVYTINLNELPIVSTESSGAVFPPGTTAEEAIATRLAQHDGELTGPEIRQFINEMFGVNLDAISALDGAKISLFSKDQWVIQNETDLFVVWTGPGDLDVKIYPTSYFIEQTGASTIPEELKDALTDLGYSYNEETGGCYYVSPTGEAVQDAFKGQTIGAVVQVIRGAYSHL